MAQTLRYGIVGVGMMGVEHIRNLLVLPGATVVAIADPCQKSISTALHVLSEEGKDAQESVKVYKSAKELYESKGCDIVIIATPNFTHKEVLLEAFKFGNKKLNILIEKPLCTTVDDCRVVLEAAKGWRGLLWVGLEYRYMGPITKLIEEAREGVVGPIKMSSIREHRFPFLKKVGDWNRFNSNTGGTLVEKCCHFWDLFNRILAPALPVRVFASGNQDNNHLDELYDGKRPDILDNAYVIAEYSSGARVMLDLCMFAEASLHQEEVSVVGPKGKLEAFLPQLEFRRGLRGEHWLGRVDVEILKDERIKYEGHHAGASYLELLDLHKAVAQGSLEGLQLPPVSLHDGFLAVVVGVAAQKSIDMGKWVKITDIIDEKEMNGDNEEEMNGDILDG